MQRLRNLHKFAGLSAGIFLLILAVTGFLLDHKNWSWMYTIQIPNSVLPQSTIEKESRLFQSLYTWDGTSYVATLRGIYEKKATQKYQLSLNIPTTDLRFDAKNSRLFASTHSGIYVKQIGHPWSLFALKDHYVNAFSLNDRTIFASVDKAKLYTIDLVSAKVMSKSTPQFQNQKESISLGRLVRDVHYARGLFDTGISLLINDIAAIMLVLLALSGYAVWIIIKRVKTNHTQSKKYLRPLIKIHGNIVTILVIIPLFLLAVTGVILNHYGFFSTFLKSTLVSSALQPPIYTTLEEDIWSVDCDATYYRVGNRLGVYESSDLKLWKKVSNGFAYKMLRVNENLYISGMGSSNRVLSTEKGWQKLHGAPHMFRSAIFEEGMVQYVSEVAIPMQKTSLYSVVLSLHDGTFFSKWWLWVYDMASLLLLVLFFTGTVRYLKKKQFL